MKRWFPAAGLTAALIFSGLATPGAAWAGQIYKVEVSVTAVHVTSDGDIGIDDCGDIVGASLAYYAENHPEDFGFHIRSKIRVKQFGYYVGQEWCEGTLDLAAQSNQNDINTVNFFTEPGTVLPLLAGARDWDTDGMVGDANMLYPVVPQPGGSKTFVTQLTKTGPPGTIEILMEFKIKTAPMPLTS